MRPRSAASRRATAFERAETRPSLTGAEPAWLTVTLDAIARHRATDEALEAALKNAQRKGRLGSFERRRAGDAVFGWGRFRGAAEAILDEHVRAYGGVPPTRRSLDAAAVALALCWAGHEVGFPLSPPFDAVVEDLPSPARRPTLPPWLEQKMAQLDDADALFAALVERAPVGLAVDTRSHPRASVQDALRAAGAEIELSTLSDVGLRARGRVVLDQLPPSLRRAVWPMDEGSQAVGLALSVSAGERVLDLCAGGGGKARLLSTLGCELVCCDIDEPRLRAARDRVGDAASYVLADGRQPPFPPDCFDAVLLDVPCTGTGTLRRAPDQAARLSEGRLDELIAIQEALLSAAASLVRPGGRVVYATCSLLPDENEAVVDRVVGQGALVMDGAPRTLRPDRDGTDGFFVARLRRPA